MKKVFIQKRSNSQTQIKAEEIIRGLPCKLEELGTLSLIQFGSETILRAAILEEIKGYLGRDRYEHGKEDGVVGYRNGDRVTTIDTPLGPVTYNRPKLTGAKDFKSNFHTPYMRRPEEFADQVAEMYVSGVSTRKVKRALSAAGDKIKMSRSTVSRITERLRAQWREWKNRDLSELNVAYLFLDAIHLGMRMGGTSKDAVFVAYAVMEDGSFEVLSIGLGNSESDKSWGSFLQDLKSRGLKDQLLVCSDGNGSVIKAIETFCPTSWRQRCVKHKMENIMAKIPKENQKELRAKLNRIFYGGTSLEQAKSFLASRRRLNVVGRHPSEEGCLSLIFQVTQRYAHELGLLDPSRLMSDTTAQESMTPYPTEVGLMKRFSDLVGKGLRGTNRALGSIRGKVKKLSSKIAGLARNSHLFAKSKEAKQRVSKKLYHSTVELNKMLKGALAGTRNLKSAANQELQRLNEFMDRLLPQILHFIQTGFGPLINIDDVDECLHVTLPVGNNSENY